MGNDISLYDLIKNPTKENFDLFKKFLRDNIGILNEFNQKVIRLRFGLDDGRCRTLSELSEEFMIPQDEISMIEQMSVQKINNKIMNIQTVKLSDFL